MSILKTKAFSEHIPVAIIGGGACGLAAALAVRDQGVECVVLERDSQPRGSTAMALGAICAANSAEHKKHGITDSPQAFIDDVMTKTEGRADPALTKTIAHESGPTLDWLTGQHGVPLKLDFKWTGLGHSVPRLHLPPGRNGEELMTKLVDAAERAGAGVLTDALVTDLYADDDGRVTGVRITRPSGEIEEFGCDAVVFATCGFGANHEMVAKNIPEMAKSMYFGHEGNKGDGINWGRELGGALGDMTAYQGLGTLAVPHMIIVPHPLLIEGGVLVNNRGERFTHELENISGMCVPVIAQPESVAWVVFDETLDQKALEHSYEQRQLTEAKAIKRAPTIEALEKVCELPAGSLQKTLDEVNSSLQTGKPDLLGRSFKGLHALQGPFCAIKVTGALFHTQGGLEVNENAQVVRKDGTPLPNVFAGGGAARSISGPDVRGYLPAMGICMAVTLGRLGGTAAGKIAKHAAG